MRITAQDLYNYTKCAHRVYLDACGDPAEKAAVSPFVELLWEMGLQTERDYLRTLGAQPYEDLQGLALPEALARTEALLREGAGLIYQGAIRAGDYLGRPDLLLRRDDRPSRLGPYYYEPIDIKAGKGWEHREGQRTHFKQHYAFQILFYWEILRALQGVAGATGRIINVDQQIEEFAVADFAAEFAAALAEVEALVGGAERSEPVLGSVCHMCHWYKKCRRWVEGTHDPTGLYNVGRIKFELKKAGLRTVDDLARMDVAAFGKAHKIPRLGETGLRKLKQRAAVRLAGVPAVRPGYALPQAAREIYFDIEDDPTQDFTYLLGWVERRAGQELGYRCLLARTRDDEGTILRQFWAFIAEAQDAVFYVYSAKERASLRRLMQRHGLDAALFERYVACEFDLYSQLVVKHSDWPTYSYGIKQIAQLIGFKWRDQDPGGANSIVWFNDYQRHPERQEILQRILAYNEDDCRAMIAVRDYFAARQEQD